MAFEQLRPVIAVVIAVGYLAGSVGRARPLSAWALSSVRWAPVWLLGWAVFMLGNAVFYPTGSWQFWLFVLAWLIASAGTLSQARLLRRAQRPGGAAPGGTTSRRR